MTVLAGVAPRDRARLLERLDELDAVARLMKQPGTLAAPRGDRDHDTTEQKGAQSCAPWPS